MSNTVSYGGQEYKGQELTVNVSDVVYCPK